MKKSEITTGAEYAYSTDSWGARQRVRVLGETQIKSGYGYRSKMITGSRVLVLDNATGQPKRHPHREGDWIIETANRNIREPWLQYAEREAAMRKARRDSQNRLAADRDTRARFLLDLIPALRHVGVEDSTTTIWSTDRDVVPYLELHMPETLADKGEGILAEKTFTAPYAASLVEYVKNGSAIKVPAEVLLNIASRR